VALTVPNTTSRLPLPSRPTRGAAGEEQCLVPTLRHGDIVIMDNLASHKVDGIKEAIECAPTPNCVICPAYSPDLDPNERLFAKIKALLRKAAAKDLRQPQSRQSPNR
jgi:transposase